MVAKRASDPAHSRHPEAGFTIIELLVAVTVLIIGLVGIVRLQMSGVRASSYSRHATEASVLAEDKMERLRTAPLTAETGSEIVDAQGTIDMDALYTRAWEISDPGTNIWDIKVTVTWRERGSAADEHTSTLRTWRYQ